MHRFYVPELGPENRVWLDREETRHLTKVLRLSVGGEVALFDGSGIECTGAIERIERDRALIAVRDRQMVDRDPRLDVTLACSVVKAKAMDLLVGKCAEMGLRQLIPIESARSVPKVERKEASHVERWDRIAVEASKQCGRTTITRIAPPRPLRAFLEKADRWDARLLFSIGDETIPLRDALAAHPSPRAVVYLIGPEGGFQRGEVKDATVGGFEAVRLGRSTLRTETAAVAALAAILYHYES